MNPFIFAIAAFSVVSVVAAATSPEIAGKGNVVTVPAGDYSVGGRVVHVAKAAEFTVEASADVPTLETTKLTDEKPQDWVKGTHPQKIKAGGVPLAGCLDGESVVVSLADGMELKRDKDYVLDAKWAGFARLPEGRIKADDVVTIKYKMSQQRIDSIEVDADGIAHLHRGEEKLTCPHPPTPTSGSVVIANVFLPYRAKTIESWQIFPIVEPEFPEPMVDSSQVAKTLAKLRAGEPVNVVTWGDSVTSGGDASSRDKAFAQLFPARLQELFPKSKITAHNAGIGATSTPGRFPALQKEVLDFHPDLVTIEFVNDMGLPEKDMRDRYAKIFQQIRDAGAEIILITPHFTMPEMMPPKVHPRGEETRPTVALLREIAKEHRVALADTSNRWAHLDKEGLPYTTLLVNGINHPDDRGHELFVKDLLLCFGE